MMMPQVHINKEFAWDWAGEFRKTTAENICGSGVTTANGRILCWCNPESASAIVCSRMAIRDARGGARGARGDGRDEPAFLWL